ncbi:MAG: radical SAM protein [Candidatus Aenigmatarchaeota archaeon]
MKIVFYLSRIKGEILQEMPLGIGYIWSFLEKKAKERGLDIEMKFAPTLDEVLAEKPDMLGVCVLSQSIDDAIHVMEEARKQNPDIKIVMGGYHITLLPELLPKIVDVGVLGEGEATFYELVQLAIVGKFGKKWFSHIRGVCYNDGEKIVCTEPRGFFENLDDLPHPKRQMCDYTGIIGVFTSRGCPYNCIYCSSSKFWKRKFRVHSADYVIDEINLLIERFKPHTIHILDDLFLADKKRFDELHQKIIANGINKKISFRAFVRANLVDEDVIRKMKEMGFVLVRFGAETGSERLLKILKGGTVSIEDGQRTIDLCHKYDIPVSASFMFGIPGETLDDLQATYDFLEKNRDKKFKIDGFFYFVPFPGTQIWEFAKKEGYIDKNTDFTKLNPTLCSMGVSKENAIYMNEKNIPFDEFKMIIEKIGKKFSTTRFQKFLAFLMKNSVLRKIIVKGVRVHRRLKK